MDGDTIIGLVLMVGALALLTGLVLWSRRRIDRIARNGYGSARAIERELDDGG